MEGIGCAPVDGANQHAPYAREVLVSLCKHAGIATRYAMSVTEHLFP